MVIKNSEEVKNHKLGKRVFGRQYCKYMYVYIRVSQKLRNDLSLILKGVGEHRKSSI